MAENPIAGLADKKVAGIPVLYIALGIGVVALYGAIAMKPSEEPSVSEEDVEGDVEGDDAGDTSVPVFSATPVIYQPSGGSVASTPMEDTNELWGRRSIEWLVSNGSTLTVASNAIDKYLNGLEMSYQEAQARDKAVKQFGIPPEGILPTNSPSAPVRPASTQGTPPLTHRVVNTRDNTASELALIYYGRNGKDAVNLIDAANIGVPHPYKIGQGVKIPPYRNPKYYKATSATRTAGDIARKNGTTMQKIRELNQGMSFPVKAGTRVRVR